MVAELAQDPTAQVAECPAVDQRKSKEPRHQQAIEVDSAGVWHIYGYDEARQVLRSDLARQAGFLSELVDKTTGQGKNTMLLKNPPILFLHGEEHHRMRRETNKFFTPSITDKQYRDFMNDYADALIGKLQQKKQADLSALTMELAMRVAAQIVGLTDSAVPGINGRMEGILNVATKLGGNGPKLWSTLLSQGTILGFLLLDVKPAIRARRKQPKNDVISYLVSRDYSDLEILTECIVYGVAGMATTREFICIALWHLMENPRLRQRMLVGSQEERYAILHEILRLEPIVGHLYRRLDDAIEIESEGQKVQIPAGALVDLNIFASNADTRMAGDNSLAICPMRPLNSDQGKVPEPVLSFGDGFHRCPGAFVAIQESDIFLRKLLEIESLRIVREPDMNFHDIVKGYEFRNFMIAVD